MHPIPSLSSSKQPEGIFHVTKSTWLRKKSRFFARKNKHLSHLECHRIWKSNLSVMIRTIKKFYVSNADFCPEALKTVAHLRLEFLGEKKV